MATTLSTLADRRDGPINLAHSDIFPPVRTFQSLLGQLLFPMNSLITFGVSEQTADFRIYICHLTKAARQRLPAAEEVSDDAFGSPIPWNLKYTAHELD